MPDSISTSALCFDPSRLLAEFGGDREAFCELAAVFLGSTPAQYESLRAAVLAQDKDTVRLEAHSIRANVAVLEAPEAVARARAIEDACGCGEGGAGRGQPDEGWPAIEAAVAHFGESLDRLNEALIVYCAQIRPEPAKIR